MVPIKSGEMSIDLEPGNPTKSGKLAIRNPRSGCAGEQSKIFDPGKHAYAKRK